MKLLRSPDGFSIEVDPEIYTIRQFADLVENRKKNTSLLLKELGYIYFFADLKSDFQFQTNEIERNRELINFLGLPDNWKKDKLLEEAIEAYKYLSQTPASGLLQSCYIMADKIKEQLTGIDLNERDKGGKPVWNIKQIQDTIKALPYVMESIEKAEKQYIKSQEENNTIRNNKQKSMYDGVDLNKHI